MTRTLRFGVLALLACMPLLSACTWNTHHVERSMTQSLDTNSKATDGNFEAVAVFVQRFAGFTFSKSESGSDAKGKLPEARYKEMGQIELASSDARGLTIQYFAQAGYCQSDGAALAPLNRAMKNTFGRIRRDLLPSGQIRIDLVAPGYGYAMTTRAIHTGNWVDMHFIEPCGYTNINFDLAAVTATLSHEITHIITYTNATSFHRSTLSEDIADDAPACFFIALGADHDVAMFKGYSHEEWYHNSIYHLGESREQPLHAMCSRWTGAMNSL
jgi:hypothetical protein